MALSDTKIRSLKPSVKSYKIHDGGGLYIQISPKGSKFWLYRYKYLQKDRAYSIGRYPDISLAEARELKDAARKLVAQGVDPVRQRKTTKFQNIQASENTLEALTRRWLDIKRIDPTHKARSLRRLELYAFPKLGSRALHDITTVEIVSCLEAIERKGILETAHRVKQLLQQVFRYAVRKGVIVHNPASDLRDMLAFPQKRNFACVDPADLPSLLRAMDNYKGNFLTCAAMQLLALTFVRTGELRGALWDEIDWARAEWRIPALRTKMRRDHIVPLSWQALALFQKLREETGRRPCIFYMPANKEKHLSEGAVINALYKMGYAGRMTGHGFRALASTILNESRKYHPDVIEKQLAHADQNEIRAAYNRADYLLERKKMMQDWADYLDSVRNNSDNVILGNFVIGGTKELLQAAE